MPDDVRQQMVAEIIANAPVQNEFWVFAYGSLIWNPAILYDEKRTCTIKGFHRSFCFWTLLGRGSEEQPGLMMGLEPGGQCSGIAYRICADKLESEVDILFRREMLSYVYTPTWVSASCDASYDNSNTDSDSKISAQDSIEVLAFVVDPKHERFCKDLDEQTMISTLATASGPLGRNCDYLFQLVENLSEIGFEDAAMIALADKVKAYLLLDGAS